MDGWMDGQTNYLDSCTAILNVTAFRGKILTKNFIVCQCVCAYIHIYIYMYICIYIYVKAKRINQTISLKMCHPCTFSLGKVTGL